MPKVKGPKPYGCPFCSKYYAKETSVYGHVKQDHPGLKYSTKTHRKGDTASALCQEKIATLKKTFMDGAIDVAEYQKTLESIKERYKQRKLFPATLDVGKILKSDDANSINEYIARYVQGQEDLYEMLQLAADCNYPVLFKKVFKHQIQITDTRTGPEITYVSDDRLVTEECEVGLLVKLYKRFVNGLASTLLPKMLPSLDGFDPEAEDTLVAISTSHEAQLKFNRVLESICGSETNSRLKAGLGKLMEEFPTALVLSEDDTSSEEST
jgi:hypothetical protein